MHHSQPQYENGFHGDNVECMTVQFFCFQIRLTIVSGLRRATEMECQFSKLIHKGEFDILVEAEMNQSEPIGSEA